MLFKRKKEELSDQTAIYHERGAPRWGEPNRELDAGITIAGFDGEGQIGNVSISGCCMKSVTYVTIAPNLAYDATIIPGKNDKMGPFSLKLKLSWTKSSENLFLAGFAVEGSEGSSHLNNYVDILRTSGFTPDYGNMKPSHR